MTVRGGGDIGCATGDLYDLKKQRADDLVPGAVYGSDECLLDDIYW